MEQQPVLAQMALHVVDVLRQCVSVAQKVHPLSLHDILCAIETAHAKRNFALVVLEFDRTAMGRKRLSERLRNVLIGQRSGCLSAFDDGHTMKKHGEPSLKMMMGAKGALAESTSSVSPHHLLIGSGLRPCVISEVAPLKVLNTRQHVTADVGAARLPIAMLACAFSRTAPPQADELERNADSSRCED